jgi:hypothetical protein
MVSWSGWGHESPLAGGYADLDPALQFRFGTSTIIFALAQEGSITHRLMDSVR